MVRMKSMACEGVTSIIKRWEKGERMVASLGKTGLWVHNGEKH